MICSTLWHVSSETFIWAGSERLISFPGLSREFENRTSLPRWCRRRTVPDGLSRSGYCLSKRSILLLISYLDCRADCRLKVPPSLSSRLAHKRQDWTPDWPNLQGASPFLRPSTLSAGAATDSEPRRYFQVSKLFFFNVLLMHKTSVTFVCLFPSDGVLLLVPEASKRFILVFSKNIKNNKKN